MRRWLPILLLFVYSGTAYGRARYNGICEQGNSRVQISGLAGTSTNLYQRSFPSCTVTVTITGTITMATLFADNMGTAQANPFTASNTGSFFFYADNGTYDAQLSGGGIAAPFTIAAIALIDPTSIGGGGGGTTPCSNKVIEPTASDNHQNIKNGATTLCWIIVFNNSATVNYGRIYNAGTGFNGCNSATNLAFEFQIPANTAVAGFIAGLPFGQTLSTGLSVCITGAYGQTDTSNAAAGVSSVNIGYQ